MKKLWKTFLRLIITLVVICLLLVGSFIYFLPEKNPLVAIQGELQQDDLTHIQNLIKSNRPDLNTFNRPKQLTISAADLNRLVQYGSQKILPQIRTYIRPDKGRIYTGVSYEIPAQNPLARIGNYLNVSFILTTIGANELELSKLRLGNISVPDLAVEYIQPYVIDEIRSRYPEIINLYNSIEYIQSQPAKLIVTYKVQKDTIKDIKQLGNEFVITDDMRARVIAYAEETDRLTKQLAEINGRKVIPLLDLMQPMFAFAQTRTEQTGDAVMENRILLLTLGAYMSGRNLASYVQHSAALPFAKLNLALQSRLDLTKHYLISAAIASVSDLGWADAIGLQKELNDSNGGSGFSFSDLMADKAGILLARQALSSEETAIRLQNKIATITSQEAILPSVFGLEDGLTSVQFKQRYKNTESYQYQKVISDIEKRLAIAELYMNTP